MSSLDMLLVLWADCYIAVTNIHCVDKEANKKEMESIKEEIIEHCRRIE